MKLFTSFHCAIHPTPTGHRKLFQASDFVIEYRTLASVSVSLCLFIAALFTSFPLFLPAVRQWLPLSDHVFLFVSICFYFCLCLCFRFSVFSLFYSCLLSLLFFSLPPTLPLPPEVSLYCSRQLWCTWNFKSCHLSVVSYSHTSVSK